MECWGTRRGVVVAAAAVAAVAVAVVAYDPGLRPCVCYCSPEVGRRRRQRRPGVTAVQAVRGAGWGA